MKKLYNLTVQSLVCVLLTICAKAQVAVTITAPAAVNACDTNIFTASFTLPQNSVLKISDAVNFDSLYYNSCHGSGGNDFTALKLFAPGGNNFYHDTINHTWNVHLSTGAHTISYYVFVDCGLVPDGSATQNINFIQTWTDSLNAFPYYLTGTDSSFSNSVLTLSIIDSSLQQFYGNYLDTVEIYHRYLNYGSADAHIRFMFNPNPSGNCGSDSIIAMNYAISDTGTIVYQPLDTSTWNIANIPINKFLIVRKTVVIKGCADTCNEEKGNFRWICNYTDTIIPFCDKCQDNYAIRQYALQQNLSNPLGVTIKLIQPSPHMADFDTSCMNSWVQWEYHIINGERNVSSAQIDLYDGVANQFYWGNHFLTLIDSADLVIEQHCNSCVIDTEYRFNNVALCHDSVTRALGEVIVSLKDFMKGDSVVIRYRTYRCSVENDTLLLDHAKYYNRWKVTATVRDTCGGVISADGKMSSNVSVSQFDFDQHLQFFPTVSDLTVPQNAPNGFGPATSMQYVNLKGMVWDSTGYQFFGDDTILPSKKPLKGYLRARIRCDLGLVVDTPLTHVVITSAIPGINVTWNSVYQYKTIPDTTCTPGDFYFFFNLSDSNALSLLNTGALNFRLRSCCPADSGRTPYDIAFHVIPLPSPGCDSAALPLSSTGDGINVHCPGCISPGIIVDSYRIQRISFGAQDSSNNRRSDIPNTRITLNSSYYNDNINQLSIFTAHHMDVLEDRQISHFQKGDTALGGYTYVQMLDSNVRLNYLQMERTFIIGADSSTQLGLTPYYLKFYIDTPNAVTPNCKDCPDYDTLNYNFRTTKIIEVTNATQINNYIQIDTSRHSIIFTFGAPDTVTGNLFDNVLFTDSLQPFYAFGETQRYRLLVRYHVCNYFAPADPATTNDEDRLKKADITNNMFLSGAEHGTDAASVFPLAPSTYDSLPSPLTQGFVDSTLYRCETFGGRFHFYSDECINGSKFNNLVDSNKCRKRVFITSTSKTGLARYDTDIDPYEFRLPSFEPYQFRIHIPPNYTATHATYYSTFYPNSFTSQNSASRNLNIQLTGANNDSVIIDIDSLLSQTCFNENWSNPADSTLYINEDIRSVSIIIPLQTSLCDLDTFYFPQLSDIVIRYRENTLQCADSLMQGCEPIFIDKAMSLPYDTLRLPRPTLSMTMTPVQTDGFSNRVCWTFRLENTLDDAYNIFVSVPQSTFLTNWTMNTGGGFFPPDTNGFFEVDTVLHPGYITLNDSLCATFLNCSIDDTLDFIYGWDCNGFPMSTADTVCFKDTLQLILLPGIAQLSPQSVAPPLTYDLCKPFPISAYYNGKSLGYVYPHQFSLTVLDPNLQVNSVYMFNCTDSLDSIPLPYSGIPHMYNITAATLDSIGISDSSLTGNECIRIEAFITPLCGSDSVLALPSMDLISTTYCGDTIIRYATFDSLSSGVAFSGISYCNDCFSVAKIPLRDTVAVGDTATFMILICGNNAQDDTLLLSEYLPSDFDTLPGSVIPDTIFVPAQGCDTVSVSGIYHTAGPCSDSVHINTVQITNAMIDTTATGCMTVIDTCTAEIYVIDSTFSSIYPGTLSDTTLYLEGRFYINTTFTLLRCTVYAAPGAQILIQGGANLTLDSTIITGCSAMWRGILAETNSTFTEKNESKIFDAECGVFAKNRTRINVINSTIADCVTGIFTPQASGGLNVITVNVGGSRIGLYANAFKPYFSGQALHDSLPRAGIELNDMVNTIGSNSNAQNSFHRMNTGVIGFRSILIVQNSEFTGIKRDNFYPFGFNGTAIADTGINSSLTVLPLASNDTTINNCYRGIYTDSSSLVAKNLKITNVNTGVYSANCNGITMSSKVLNNLIECSRWGVQWVNNTGSGGMQIEDNTIFINHSPKAAISISETSNSNPVNYLINGNVIYSASTNDGIHALNVYQPSITNNQIYMTGVPDTLRARGIRINGCSGATVLCNTVKGVYPGNNHHSRGILTTISDNSWIGCNTVDSTYYGFFFGGVCTGTLFEGNAMNDHFTGLYLNSAAIIDQQPPGPNPPWHGNTWRDSVHYTSGYGAVNMNDSTQTNLIASLFTTYDSILAYNPIIPTDTLNFPFYVNDQGWFSPQNTDSTFNCDSSNTCSTSSRNSGSGFGGLRMQNKNGMSDDLRQQIAEGNSITSDFMPESKMVAQQNLYAELIEDTAALQSDTLYQSFVNARQDESIGYLFEARESFSKMKILEDSSVVILLSNIDLIRVYTDSISIIDSIANADTTVNYAVLREELIDQINSVQQTVNSFLQQQKINDLLHLAAAEVKNNDAVPHDIPDANEKFINLISILFQRDGINAIESYYAQILDIALQCPFSGGRAVYRARPFVEMFNETIEYDDDNICEQQGIYKTAQNHQTELAIKDILIKPNPANDQTEIILLGEYEGWCKIILEDMTGRTMNINTFDCKQKRTIIATSGYTQGVYQISIIINNKYVKSTKLVIVR